MVNSKLENPLEIRVIIVGCGGWQFIEEHVFNQFMHPQLGLAAEQIMFIGRTGRLFPAPRPTDQQPLFWDFSVEGEGCERDIGRIDDFRTYFNDSRPEIVRFVQSSDWILLVASLDNGMAFIACEELVQMCRDVGARVIGLVGAPYLGGGIEDPARCEKLVKASDDTVARMIESGCPVILDGGFWGGSGGAYDPIKWHWHQKDNSVGLITQVLNSQYTEVFEGMVASSSRLNFSFAVSDRGAEAIQEAIDSDWEWTTGLDGQSKTVTGAVVRVMGCPERLDSIRAEIWAELQNPAQFKRNGLPYWCEDAKFIVITQPEGGNSTENSRIELTTYIVGVLSSGIESGLDASLL